MSVADLWPPVAMPVPSSVSSSVSSNLASELESWEKRFGQDPALAWGSGVWSFADLARESRKRASALRRIGVRRGTHVGLLQPNRPEWLACAFGAWRLGATLVPLNTLYRPTELRHALAHADVEVIIAERSFLRHDYLAHLESLCPHLFTGAAAAPAGDLPHLRVAVFSGSRDVRPEQNWDEVVEAAGEDRQPPDPAPGDATIFFTSGSTAAPKGVVHTHGSMLRAAQNVGERLGLNADDRTYGYLPMFFNGGLVGVGLATLMRGGAVLLQDVFDPAAAVQLMERFRCSVFFGWPHQAEAIAGHPSFDRQRLGLRKGPGANASWAGTLLRDDHECVGTWGMSETGPMAACSDHADPIETRRASHGRAMPGLEIQIVDEVNRPLPPNTVGEIKVRGDSLMRTYYRSDPTECFDQDRYFHTGDQGRLDELGSLTFIGRLRDVIKTAGVNVAAAEVEDALLQHAQIESAYVVPVPHPTRGENVAAFVVAHGDRLDLGEVADHCRDRLASYKVPRHLFRVEASDVPTLGSGKVDRKQLRSRAAARVDESTETADRSEPARGPATKQPRDRGSEPAE